MPSPFDPQATQDTPQATLPTQQPGAPDTTQQAGGWRDWIARPDNRAALMQFGIAMLQPVGIGETPLSHAASAVGQGGEAAQRVQGQEMKKQELESRQELRAAQAQAAEARAGAAGSRSDAAATRLAFQQSQGEFRNRIQAELAYQGLQRDYARALQKHAQEKLLDPTAQPPQPPPSREEYMSRFYPGAAAAQSAPALGGLPSPQDVDQLRELLQQSPNDPRVQAAVQDFRRRGVQI